MEINRNLKTLTNWRSIRKWTIYHDLELFKLSKTSQILIIFLFLLDLIQRLSLITLKFPIDSKLNKIHRKFYEYATDVISLKTTIKSSKELFSISIACYMILKFAVSCYFYYIAQTVKVLRSKAAQTLRFFEFLKFLDVTILLIPITKDCFLNIFSDKRWELIMVSIGSLMILNLEFCYMQLLSVDLKFIKQNLLQGRDSVLNFLRFYGLTFLTLLKVLNDEKLKSEDFAIFINFLNFILGLWLLSDFISKLHFMQNDLIRKSYLIMNLLYTIESLFSIIFFFYKNFINLFDMDYMVIVVFMLVVNFTLICAKNKEVSIANKYVFEIENILEADQYMENLSFMFKKTNDKRNKLRLFSLLKLHFEKCSDLRCLCFLLKYPLKKTKERRLVDHLDKADLGKDHLKLILYDDVVAMEILKKEHEKKRNKDQENSDWQGEEDEIREESDFGELTEHQNSEHKKGFYLVNLKSKDLPTVFASFYHILLSNFSRKNPILLFESYLSFLVYEVENYVGTLINTYNYIFSPDYKIHSSFTKNIKLMNYIDISSKKLHREFLNSPYWLSSKRIYDVFYFSKRVDKVEQQFTEIVKLNVEFYQELLGSSINFKFLLDTGEKIVKIKEWMIKEFEELFEITKDNTKIISLFINFKLNVDFEQDEAITDYYEKLHYLYKFDVYKTLQELATHDKALNLYSNKNMLVFVNILKSKFYISKFTSNMPNYFGMDAKELRGKSLSDLMPLEISKDHDRYVLDFVNQKKSPIIKTASLTSFAMTKTGDLKLVSVLVKVEYLMTDDVYLCGIIVPHPKNKEVLILSNLSGKIIGMNKKAKSLLGTMIIDNPYSLFISIPLLVKYFYPEIEKQLRYSKFSLRRDKKSVIDKKDGEGEKNLGMNFELETEEFAAFFFKYMLSDKVKFKGILQDSKSGILKNFGFDDLLQWNILREINSKMLMPKHIRILSRVIAKNRQLMINHSDEILTTFVTVDTYKHRGNLHFKLIGLNGIGSTNDKVKKFFVHAAQNLKGEMADVFMVAPQDINNLYKILKVERLIKISTLSDSKKSFLIENSCIEEASYSPDQIRKKSLISSKKNTDPTPKSQTNFKKSFKKKRSKVKSRKTEEIVIEHHKLKDEEIYREEDLLGDIGNDSICINPEDYHFDRNFAVKENELLESKDNLMTTYKKAKKSLGPKGSTLNKSGHRKVSFMSKKNTVIEPVNPEETNKKGEKEIEKELKNIYGTKNLDETSQKEIPKIQVNAPNSSKSHKQSKSEFEHSEEEEDVLGNPPNFRYLKKQKSVESRLKYLSEIYTELIKTAQAKDFLQSVRQVMDIGKLREIEAGEKSISSFKDTEDQFRDMVIKIDTDEDSFIENRLQKESTKKAKDMITYTADNMKRSSIASYQSRVIARTGIKQSILKTMKNVFSKPLTRIKLLVFFLLIILTILIRVTVNQTIDGHVNSIVEFKQFTRAVSPIGYFYKDMIRYQLFLNGYLDVKTPEERSEFFNVDILNEMETGLSGHFSYLTQNDIGGLTSEKHEIEKKFSKEKIGDLSFFTLYVHLITDYNILLENLDPANEEKLIKSTHRFDLGTSIVNSFELIYESSTNFNQILEVTSRLEKDYSLYYLIFLLTNIALTICIGFILIVLNIRANQKIEMMSSLLLRIEKEKIHIYSEKFNRVQTSIKLITKQRVKASDKNELKKTLKMGKKKDKLEKTRRKNFSTFVSKYHSSNVLVCFLILITMIFVNIPIAVDYFLISNIVKEAGTLNSISINANLLGGDLYSFYGVFYDEMLNKYKGTPVDKRAEEIMVKFDELYDKRDALQNLISGYSDFNNVQEKSICDYYNFQDQKLMNLCNFVTKNQKNYNLFLALSDIVNFEITTLATVVKSSKSLISTHDFLNFDRMLYFIAKNLEKVMEVANEKISENLASKKMISVLFFVMFSVFMVVYYLVYRRFLIRNKTVVMYKLGCCYLALPPHVIGANSYLINFLSLRRQGGF